MDFGKWSLRLQSLQRNDPVRMLGTTLVVVALQSDTLSRLDKSEPIHKVAHVLTHGVYDYAASDASKFPIVQLLRIHAGDVEIVDDAVQQQRGNLAGRGIDIH